MSYREPYRRVEARVASGSEKQYGIRRWSSDLIEPRLYKLALKSGAGALTLAVVAWVLVEIRVGESAKESGEKDERHLSYQGGRRMGLRDVICLEHTDSRYAQQIKVRFRGVEKSIACGFYVNVSDLLDRSPELSGLVGKLRAELLVAKVS